MTSEGALTVDARGRRCPLPVIDLARRIVDVPVGGQVVVLADDPAAATDIPAWCRLRGHRYVGATSHGAATAYTVRREGAGRAP